MKAGISGFYAAVEHLCRNATYSAGRWKNSNPIKIYYSKEEENKQHLHTNHYKSNSWETSCVFGSFPALEGSSFTFTDPAMHVEVCGHWPTYVFSNNSWCDLWFLSLVPAPVLGLPIYLGWCSVCWKQPIRTACKNPDSIWLQQGFVKNI